MAAITRIGQSRCSATRGRIVVHGGVLTSVATAAVKSSSVYEQARDALANISIKISQRPALIRAMSRWSWSTSPISRTNLNSTEPGMNGSIVTIYRYAHAWALISKVQIWSNLLLRPLSVHNKPSVRAYAVSTRLIWERHDAKAKLLSRARKRCEDRWRTRRTTWRLDVCCQGFV